MNKNEALKIIEAALTGSKQQLTQIKKGNNHAVILEHVSGETFTLQSEGDTTEHPIAELETILLEYESYHQIKFKNYAKK